jgi:hypothetical protein
LAQLRAPGREEIGGGKFSFQFSITLFHEDMLNRLVPGRPGSPATSFAK